MNQYYSNTEQVPIMTESFTNCYHYIDKSEPVIIRGLDIGPCVKRWTPEFLADKVGTCEVKLHVSQSPKLDFIKKNFSYKSLSFCDFIKRASESVHKEFFVCEEEFYYLRSLGKDPRHDVADFRTQFPTLLEDIIFPDLIQSDKIFSSVFRIASAGLVLWTHYDVMDNILIQVKGQKRVILFPPSDALNMYLNGDKSEVLDVENPDFDKYPKFTNVRRKECLLEAGDILYIPALWFHNVKYLEFGIAINVFWKELDAALYDKKDPYGNKDLLPAQQAFASTERVLKSLSKLPPHYKQFYCQRLIDRIQKDLL